jgi:hypothetical protein
MAIVWACALSVEEYAAAGREVEVPRAPCPSCGDPMQFRSGYWRYVRSGGVCLRMWVARGSCGPCDASHALLPSFLLVGRLDVVGSVGKVIDAVVDGGVGVRSAIEGTCLPHTTARDFVRRFRSRAAVLHAGFAALGVELGDEASMRSVVADLGRMALRALRGAWHAGLSRLGLRSLSRWGFASVVCGGKLIATTTDPPWFVIGRRRFMPPVP